MARLPHSRWGRFFSVVIAYAVVLQGLIFAAGFGQPAVAANNTALAGFELCTHSGAGLGLPVAPSQAPVGDCDHCPFCIAGTLYLNCAPPSPPQYSKVVLTDAAWPLVAPRLVAFLVNESARPRGPPAAA